MDFTLLQQRAYEIRRLYADLEHQTYGRAWTREEIAQGFVGDVGDLMKLVLAHSGVREIPEAEQQIAHELADCLWSILVLAEKYQVDIVDAFLQNMDELEQSIQAKLA